MKDELSPGAEPPEPRGSDVSSLWLLDTMIVLDAGPLQSPLFVLLRLLEPLSPVPAVVAATSPFATSSLSHVLAPFDPPRICFFFVPLGLPNGFETL